MVRVRLPGTSAESQNGKLDGTYNRHDYDDDKQVALETLERKLNGIVSGTASNVIPIAAG